ncbi:hypothetical protein M3J09_013480 [Ascochyta lentis]
MAYLTIARGHDTLALPRFGRVIPNHLVSRPSPSDLVLLAPQHLTYTPVPRQLNTMCRSCCATVDENRPEGVESRLCSCCLVSLLGQPVSTAR